MKKGFRLIPLVILLVVFLLTIGYSAFSAELSITNSVAFVRSQRVIRITNVTSNNSYVTNLNHSVKPNTDNVSIIVNSVSIPNNQSVTYSVTVTNLGNVPMAISDVSFSNGNTAVTGLSYSFSGYTENTRICSTSNICTGNFSKTFDFTITNTSGSTLTTPLNIYFTFNQVHDVYYNNTDIGDVVHGKNFSYTWQSNAPSWALITSGNYSSYNYINDNTLSIVGATSDIYAVKAWNIYYDTTLIGHAQDNGNFSYTWQSNAPSDVTLSGTFTSKTYTNDTLSIVGVQSNITVTESSGGNTTTTTTTNPDGSTTTTTTNYDSQGHPTDGNSSNTDTNGNTNTQEYDYVYQGNEYVPVVTGYTIDTSGNPNGGETITTSIDTGMVVFDGKGFEMNLVFKAKLGSDLTNNIWAAVQRGTQQKKYSGFNMTVKSNTYVTLSGGENKSYYSNSGQLGNTLHGGTTGFRISSTYNKVETYTVKFTYLPANYGANNNSYPIVICEFSPLSSGAGLSSPYTSTSSYASRIPTSLDSATFTLGGNGIDSGYNMTTMEVISFSVHKI